MHRHRLAPTAGSLKGRAHAHSAVIAFAMETQLLLNHIHPITKKPPCQAQESLRRCTAFVFS